MSREEKPQKKEEGTSLLAFLTGEVDEKPKTRLTADKPKPSLGTDKQQTSFGADKPKARERPTRRTKIPKDEHRDILDIGEVPTEVPPPPRKFEDDSSICEEVKEDPSAAAMQMRGSGDGKKV